MQAEGDILKAILENSEDKLLVIDTDYKVVYFNKAAKASLHTDPDKALEKGCDYRNCLSQPAALLFEEAFVKILKGEPGSFDLETNENAQPAWVHYKLNLFTDPGLGLTQVLVSIINIDKRKRREIAQKEMLDRFLNVMDNTSESIIFLGPDYKVLLLNKISVDRLRDHAGSEVKIGSDFRNYLYKGSEYGFYESFSKALKGEEVALEVETTVNGRALWFLSRMCPVYDSANKLLGISIFAKNFDAQKKAESALKQSEEKFRKIIESAANPILVLNEDLEITLANSETERVFGYKPAEIYGEHIRLLIPSDSDRTDEYPSGWNLDTSLRTGFKKQMTARKKNGGTFFIEAGLNTAEVGQEKFVFVIIQDLSQRILSEQKLQKTNQQLSLLNTVNDIILLTGNEEKLVTDLCKAVVDTGEYKLACICIKPEHDGEVRMLGLYGEAAYMHEHGLSHDDPFLSAGPTSTALKFNYTVVTTPRLHLRNHREWIEHAKKRGIVSAIVLPIRFDDKLSGSLNIYSHKDDVFDELSILLLERLSNNISRAIQNIRISQEKEAARYALNERVKELRTIYLVTQALQDESQPIKTVLSNIINLIPNGWQYPEICSARILFDGEEFVTKNYRASDTRQSADFKFVDGKTGSIEVLYAYKPNATLENQFLDEERELLSNLAEMISTYYNKAAVSTNLQIAEAQRKIITDTVRQMQETQEKLMLAKEDAENANKAKSEFLANISHEIRTPLNSMLGFSELLKNNNKDPRAEKYIDGILTGGKNLLSLINDILDLSKMEAGQMAIQNSPVNLKQLVSEFKQLFSNSAEEKGLDFKIRFEGENMPAYVLLDETRIRQILFNLLGNAFKFTHEGEINLSVIFIRVSQDPSKTHILFKVQDTGIGIPESQQKLIFEAFRQQDGQSNRKYGGTGLGLTITKRLVDIMGGRIGLEGAVGIGSTFSVLINDVDIAENYEEPADRSDLPVCYEFRDQTILLVEDIAMNRDVFKGFLEETHVKVVTAVNGQEAVTLIEEVRPNLVLMDLMMPVMDGYEATRIIRASEKFKTTPVIAVTAAILPEDQAVKSLFDAIISKPLSKRVLLEAAAKHLINTWEKNGS